MIKFFVLGSVRLIRKIYFGIFNFIILKVNKVIYSSFPYVDGSLIVVNRGQFLMGNQLKFNSSLYSNFVGLYKPCTIEIQKNGSLIIGDYSGFSGVSIFCAKSVTIGKYLTLVAMCLYGIRIFIH